MRRFVALLVWTSCLLAATAQAAGEQPRFRAEADAVRVPVVVIGEDDQLLTTLGKENFRILENGEPREIVTFSGGRSEPLTLVVLLEYSEAVRRLRRQIVRPAGVLASQILGPDDYAALIAFDIRPRILADFTRNRQRLLDAIHDLLRGPAMSRESNLYDAVRFALVGGVLDEVEYKGLAEVEGRTALLVVATGLNSFSRANLEEVRRTAASAGVPVYSIGVGEMIFVRAGHRMSSLQRMEFLRARSFLDEISRVSGGRAYHVRFQGAIDDVLESIVAMLRFQYTLTYQAAPGDGRKEKREIEVLIDVDGDGNADNDRLKVQHRREYRIERRE